MKTIKKILQKVCKIKNFIYLCRVKVINVSHCRECRLIAQKYWAFFMPIHKGGCFSFFTFSAHAVTVMTLTSWKWQPLFFILPIKVKVITQ